MNLTDLPAFAAAVRSACSAVPPAGRVGGFAPRVWIHAAWAVGRFDESLAEFKRWCVEANRTGLLRLSRCDMPEAFDAYDVERSEATDRGATYNLIRVG